MTIAIAHIILTVIPLILLRNRLTNRLDSIPVGSLEITLVSTGIRACEPWTPAMPPDTRTQDLRRLEESLQSANKEHAAKYEQVTKLLEVYGQKMESHEVKFGEIKDLISGLTFQQSSFLQKLSLGRGEPIANHEQPGCSNGATRNNWTREADQHSRQVHRPRRDFPSFNGDNVYQWLFRCNQYFEITEMNDSEKLKQASYYMDDRALYWHQNFVRHRPDVQWSEYIEALCCRFGGQKDPLEELKDLKQKADLETYIQEFDILWNRAKMTERQALVFFLEGLEVEIKNMVKMFEPKTLYQAYNLARLQENTISHR